MFWRQYFLQGILLVFVLAGLYSIYAVATDKPHKEIILAVAGFVGVVAAADQLWDRFRPIETGETGRVPSEETYLKRRLQEFQKEEALFVELAGETEIPLKYDRYADAFTHQERGERLREYEDIQQAILDENHTQFVIVGDPGAGKSTTLRRLAASAINARLGKPEPLIDGLYPIAKPVPLWINLGAGENPPDAANLIEYEWNKFNSPEGNCKTALENGAVWLFLDGLNEMPEQKASRKERAASLKAFLKQYPQGRAVITCRVLDYDGELNLELPVVYVRPLDAPRIENFIRKRLPEKADSLLEKINTNEAIGRIAENPYTLVMLIDIYRERNTLPENLHDLYRIYTDVRYEDYRQRSLMHLPQKQLERKLQKLAFQMINQYRGTSAEIRWAQKQIGRRALKDGFAMGVLLQDGDKVRFFHQSLHGYYALPLLQWAMKRQWFDFSEKRHAVRVELFIDSIGSLGEAAAPAVPVLLEMLTMEMLEMEIQDKLSNVGEAANYALRKVGEPAVPVLIEGLQSKDKEVHRAAALALEGILWWTGLQPKEGVSTLIEALKDADEWVRCFTARTLGAIRAAEAVPALIDVLEDIDVRVRAAASGALGRIRAVEAVPALIDVLLEDTDKEVRHSATEALAQIGETIPLSALKDENGNVHSSVAEALGELRAFEAITALITTLRDEDWLVRDAAVAVLAWIGAPAIPALIAALKDEDWRVSNAAAKALRKIATPEAKEALRNAGYDVD